MGGQLQIISRILKSNLSKTKQQIKDHLGLSLISLCLQLLLILAVSVIFIGASLDLSTDLQKITNPLVQITDDYQNADENEILKQSAKMYSGYISLIKNMVKYTLLSLASFLIFGGLLWVTANLMQQPRSNTKLNIKQVFTKPKIKYFFLLWRRFTERSLLVIIPYFAIAIITIAILAEKDLNTFYAGLTFLLVLDILSGYLLFISVSILSQSGWKALAKSIKYLAIKKAKYILITAIATAAVLTVIGYLLYQVVLVSEVFSLMIIFVLMLTASLFFARLYLTTLITEFNKNN
ncbi:hypothetical protein HOC01_04165 [archaeon]|jgi:hypothetical protein|nr:hypothetical protein [archaeon]MBT6698392.1 hypothetical protein [archaeon]